jgi:hypothetical protein
MILPDSGANGIFGEGQVGKLERLRFGWLSEVAEKQKQYPQKYPQ